MFLSEQCLCLVSIGAARARMADLVEGGWLGGACAAAYQDGITGLLWPVLSDGLPAAPPQLVQTHFLEPVHHDDVTVMGMRWQATGLTGQLFPALDADITLTAEGNQHTQVTLTGVYRSPLGPLSHGLDRALVHQAATTTVASVLTRISGALQNTTPAPGDAGRPESPGPVQAGQRQPGEPD